MVGAHNSVLNNIVIIQLNKSRNKFNSRPIQSFIEIYDIVGSQIRRNFDTGIDRREKNIKK